MAADAAGFAVSRAAAPERSGQFWINADLFWNGSRIDHARRRLAQRARDALDAATPKPPGDGC